MTFSYPYIILYGGHGYNELNNETWILSIEKVPFVWNKLSFSKELPCPRIYHSMGICMHGTEESGKIYVFGGRGKDQNSLNDLWCLKRDQENKWEWQNIEYKGKKSPKARSQVDYKFIILI
jgi:hypothetical protein